MDILFRKKIISVVAIGLVNLLFGVNHQELFLRGNESYKQGKWQEAFDNYALIKTKGYAILYNLGLCAHRMGDDPLAFAYMMYAQKYSDTQGYMNCHAFIQSLCEEHKIPFSTRYYDLFFMSRLSSIPIGVLQLLFLLLWVLLWVFMLKLYASCWRYHIISAILLIIILLGMMLAVHYHKGHSIYGVIKQTASVHAGPGLSFKERYTEQPLSQIVIMDVHGSWVKVANANGSGWIERNYIVCVEEGFCGKR